MLVGGVTAATAAAILSFPLFRMKGFYFLIGSFAAGEIIRADLEALYRSVRRSPRG